MRAVEETSAGISVDMVVDGDILNDLWAELLRGRGDIRVKGEVALILINLGTSYQPFRPVCFLYKQNLSSMLVKASKPCLQSRLHNRDGGNSTNNFRCHPNLNIDLHLIPGLELHGPAT